MSKVILQRQKSFVLCLRAFKVIVDDREVAKINNGKQVVLDLDAGEHELSLKFDWFSSRKLRFTISKGEEKYFTCGPGMLRPELQPSNKSKVEQIQATGGGGLDMSLEFNWQTLVVFMLLLAALVVAGARGYAYLKLNKIKTVDHLAFNGEEICVLHDSILYMLTPGGWLRESISLADLGIDTHPDDVEFAGKDRLLIGNGKTISLCNINTRICMPVELSNEISTTDNYKFTYDKNRDILYVANTNDHAVLVKDMSNNSSFTMSGVELSYPNDMLISATGNLLIADTKNSRISALMLDASGHEFSKQHDVISIKELPQPRTSFSSIENITEKAVAGAVFSNPSPLALAGSIDGNLWVVVADAYIDYGEIWKFAEDGTLIDKISLSENSIPLDIIQIGKQLLVSDTQINQVYSIDQASGNIDVFGDESFQEILAATRDVKNVYHQIKNNSFNIIGVILVGLIFMLFIHKRSRIKKT